MTAGSSPTPAPDEESSSFPTWLVVSTGVLAVVVVGVIAYGYSARPGWIGVSDKTFWDYLELLIVPGALALGVYWLNRSQDERERVAEDARNAHERETQRQHAEHALEVENQRAQQAVLQAYLDQMSQLLLDKDRPLRKPKEGEEERTLARARTLAALDALGPKRQRRVLRFLQETQLIQASRPQEAPPISLQFARMRGITMRRGLLLKGVDLSRAILTDADLRGADLTGTRLNGANLTRAKLTNANLTNADLTDAKGVTNEELDQQAKSLKGATMPNGQKYEEWLKSKGSGEE